MAQTTSSHPNEIWKAGAIREERSPVDGVSGDGHLAAYREARKGPGDALVARMKGPGGYYNIGNALALTAGLGVQIAAVSGGDGQESGAILQAARLYFVGSSGAAALTIAVAIFVVSGEMYHRAWSRGFPPDRRGNWWGDFLSGVAAVVLTYALAAFGDVLLAAVSGLLLAAGKFGSALVPEDYAAPTVDPWPNRFRTAVLASRVPALAALSLEFTGLLRAGAESAGSLIMTGVMLVCYLLWARADLLLFAGAARVRAR